MRTELIPFFSFWPARSLPRRPAAGNSSGATSSTARPAAPPIPPSGITIWETALMAGATASWRATPTPPRMPTRMQRQPGYHRHSQQHWRLYFCALQTGAPGASTKTTDLSWQYGLVVARIKLPFGQGVWPAFWMLGENFSSVGWPACGEIDIMENFGTFNNNININNGNLHGPIAAAVPLRTRTSAAHTRCSMESRSIPTTMSTPFSGRRILSRSMSMACPITPARHRPSPPASGSLTIRSSSS